MSILKQVAALPVRVNAHNKIEILLITSRDTGRWVIPKGGQPNGLTKAQAAEAEAFEEAGVKGDICSSKLGTFEYRKDGQIDASVSVYRLDVTTVLKKWPEKGERRRKWFSAKQAAELVDERDLSRLIAGLTTIKAGKKSTKMR